MESIWVFALAMAVAGLVNIGCFLIGAKVGQTVSRGGTVELPELNPVKAARAYAESRKQTEEERRREIILRNIDSYDGTGLGQQEVPR